MNNQLNYLTEYPFQYLSNLLEEIKKEPEEIIGLHIGEPKGKAPEEALKVIFNNSHTFSKYPTSVGDFSLREAYCAWLSDRFSVNYINPDLNVLPLSGTREGIFSFIQCAIDSSKENPNVRPPKGSYQRFYVTGYDAWLSNYIQKHNMDKKYNDFPWPESEKIIKQYIECLKSEPYKAVDFDQTKGMSEQGSEYVIKYAGGISVYFKKKKIGLINIHRTGKGEFIHLQASKHPKHNNAPLILKNSNIEFDHRRKIKELDETNKEITGAWGFVDFMETNFNPKNTELTNEVTKFLIDESAEVRTVAEVNKELITEKKIHQYVESFKTKRKDSNEYTEARDFLKAYFDDDNKKEIDL